MPGGDKASGVAIASGAGDVLGVSSCWSVVVSFMIVILDVGEEVSLCSAAIWAARLKISITPYLRISWSISRTFLLSSASRCLEISRLL